MNEADQRYTRQIKREFERSGYVLVQEHGFLPHQYFLVFATARP